MKKTVVYLMFLMVPLIAYAYSSGPPDGKTGAPGEGTCHDCHNSFPLNSGDGNFQIQGPAQYVAGQTYTITIQISDPGHQRWGFEFTNLGVGTITIIDPTNTQLSGNYAKHTSTGTHNGTPNGPVTWTFDWTAPTINPPDSIIFYAAGNAANGNFNNQGDYIYTTHFTTHFVTTGIDEGTPLPEIVDLHNYPNPFNASTTIGYNVPSRGNVSLQIYDLSGRKIQTLVNEYQEAGNHRIAWNADRVPSGIYFYKLATSDYSESKSMTLVK